MRTSVNRPPTPDAADGQEKELTLQEIISIKVGSSLVFVAVDVECSYGFTALWTSSFRIYIALLLDLLIHWIRYGSIPHVC